MTNPGNESHTAETEMSGLNARGGRPSAMTGAVVVIVNVNCVSPLLPLFTCVGLNVQVLNGGQLPEYARIALLGNDPFAGTTSRT
jgi:hypothetical protein